MKQPETFNISVEDDLLPQQQMILDAWRFCCGLYSYDNENEDPPEWMDTLLARWRYVGAGEKFNAVIQYMLEQIGDLAFDICQVVGELSDEQMASDEVNPYDA